METDECHDYDNEDLARREASANARAVVALSRIPTMFRRQSGDHSPARRSSRCAAAAMGRSMRGTAKPETDEIAEVRK